MDEQVTATGPATEGHPDASIFSPYRRRQILVITAVVVCYAVFWFGGKAMGIPSEPGYSASLLQQPSAIVTLLVTAVLLACCVILGTLIAGRTWPFAGLLAALTGLSALSMRGGPLRYVLFRAQTTGSSPFAMLLLEQCLLFGLIGGAWLLFWGRRQTSPQAPEGARVTGPAPLGATAVPDLIELNEESARDKGPIERSTLTAIIAQVAIMGVMILLLAATDVKKQVLVVLFLAAFSATSLSEHFFAERDTGRWYWLGPFIIGALGYLLACFSQSASWATGDLTGGFAGLARPLPLDYASVACTGTLLGWWIGGEHPEYGASIIAAALFGVITHPIGRASSPQPPEAPRDNGQAG